MESKTILILILLVAGHCFSQPGAEKPECGGTERWSQKVLTDNLVSTINFTPIGTTIASLVSMPTPSPDPNMPRQAGVEDKTYSVVCHITIKKAESDNDFHLVISDGWNTMVSEIPDPACSAAASSAYVNDFINARNFINANIAAGNVYNVNIPQVVVHGVAFVDPPHGQTGAAPNNLELHPIIDVHFYQPQGIRENKKILSADVFPSPAKDNLNINVNSSYELGHCDFKIFNAQGALVETISLQNSGFDLKQTVSIGNLAPGIYIFELLSFGSSIYEGKFIKE
jgi:hypothetical protein